MAVEGLIVEGTVERSVNWKTAVERRVVGDAVNKRSGWFTCSWKIKIV